MQVKTRTVTIHRHYIDIDGREFETTFSPYEYIDPKVEIEANKTTITYAVQDEYAQSPREFQSSIMIVTGNERDYQLDHEDSDMSALRDIAGGLESAIKRGETQVYYLPKCACWGSLHETSDIEAGECPTPFDMLLFGKDDDTFEDGSTWAIEIPLDNHGDLESNDGIFAMLAAATSGTGWTTELELMKAYIEVGRPDITAFTEWSAQGYSQGDWASGYAYLTDDDFTDPKAALDAEIEEYANFFRGDVYMLARDKYVGDASEDYDCIGGYYGDDAIKAAIQDGGQF